MTRRPALLLLALATAACTPAPATAPGAPATAAASAAPTAAPTATPAASGSPSAAPAPTASPSVAPADPGVAMAIAAAQALAAERMLIEVNLLADGLAAPGAAAPLPAGDAELQAAAVAVALTADGRAAATARRAALRAKAEPRLATHVAWKTSLEAAFQAAGVYERPGGGRIVKAAADLAGAGGATWKATVVRATDAQDALVFAAITASLQTPTGGVKRARTVTLRPDGGATVRFSLDVADASHPDLKSAWNRVITATGAGGGGGQLAVPTGGAAPTTVIATLKGTEIAPMVVVKDAAAKVEAEASLPIDGAPSAVVVRAEGRVPVAVAAE